MGGEPLIGDPVCKEVEMKKLLLLFVLATAAPAQIVWDKPKHMATFWPIGDGSKVETHEYEMWKGLLPSNFVKFDKVTLSSMQQIPDAASVALSAQPFEEEGRRFLRLQIPKGYRSADLVLVLDFWGSKPPVEVGRKSLVITKDNKMVSLSEYEKVHGKAGVPTPSIWKGR